MTDIFHEIEEDLRRDRFRKLWDRFGWLVIALALATVLGTAGWSGYKYWRTQQAANASARFEAADALARAGQHQEAEQAFEAVAKDAPSGYRAIARFRAASEAAARDPAAGVSAFDAIANDGSLDALSRDMARLRAAMILVDTAPASEITQRLSGLAAAGQPLRHAARELIALAQYRAGDLAAANKSAQELAEDSDTPAGVRSRAELIRQLTAAAVPAPTAPAAPQALPATQ